MLFIIYAEDAPGKWETRKAVRADHLARMQPLVDEGRLFVAGPCPVEDTGSITDAGVSGSVIIADFDNLDDAKSWASQDPYVKAGVYANVSIKPFIKVLPQ